VTPSWAGMANSAKMGIFSHLRGSIIKELCEGYPEVFPRAGLPQGLQRFWRVAALLGRVTERGGRWRALAPSFLAPHHKPDRRHKLYYRCRLRSKLKTASVGGWLSNGRYL